MRKSLKNTQYYHLLVTRTHAFKKDLFFYHDLEPSVY